jgi:hypothetical protein
MKDFFRFVVTFNSFGLHLKTISIRKLVAVSIWRLKGRGATCCAQRQLQFPVIDAAKASALPLDEQFRMEKIARRITAHCSSRAKGCVYPIANIIHSH